MKYSDNSQYELAVDAFTGETDRFRSGDIDIRRADFSEKVSAAYTSGVNRLMFGLEYSGIYFNVGENLPIQNSTEKIFHSLLPSVSWSRKLSGVNTLSVNFSSSSEVTDYRNFARWIEDSDPMSVTIGNPSLRPSSGYDYSMYSEYLTLDARWDISKRVNMTGSYIFHWQHSAVEGKDFVNNVLGFSAGVWLFKNRTARLAINAYDVLGSRNFVSTVMNDRYIQNRYGNVVTNILFRSSGSSGMQDDCAGTLYLKSCRHSSVMADTGMISILSYFRNPSLLYDDMKILL